MLLNMYYFIKKYLFCIWFHDEYLCFPDVGVGGKGLDGWYHCAKCDPCSRELMKMLGRSSAE